MKEKLFSISAEEKQLLQKISSLCGVKQDIIKEVWQYTFYCIFLELLENRDKNNLTILIPYLGKIICHKGSDGEDTWAMLTNEFKQIINDIRKNKQSDLIKYFEDNFILKVLENLEQKE